MIFVHYSKITPYAFAPKRNNTLSIGYDLLCPHKCILKPLAKHILFLKLAFQIPENCYGRIAYTEYSICDTVIDSMFRSNVGVVVMNTSNRQIISECGIKFCQLIIERISRPALICKELEDLQ